MRLLCLHGFLGQAADWDFLPGALDARRVSASVAALSLWPLAERGLDLPGAAAAVAEHGKVGDVLVGYSLGGRLAALAFAAEPERWSALVMISAHPGGLEPVAVDDRRTRDQTWAHRFETWPWSDVVAVWNAQPVFSGSGVPERRGEWAVPRASLAHVLTHWSPAHQPDLRSALATADRPVVWLAGGRDERYAALAPDLKAVLPRARVWVLPDAGHRLPWDAPEALADELAALLERLP